MAHPVLLVCHWVKQGEAQQEPEHPKSALGDADKNVAGNRVQEPELPPFHCLWNKLLCYFFFHFSKCFICNIYVYKENMVIID